MGPVLQYWKSGLILISDPMSFTQKAEQILDGAYGWGDSSSTNYPSISTNYHGSSHLKQKKKKMGALSNLAACKSKNNRSYLY